MELISGIAPPTPPPAVAPLTCTLCGRTDSTVAETPVKEGVPWPPACSECLARAHRVARKAAVLAAIEAAPSVEG